MTNTSTVRLACTAPSETITSYFPFVSIRIVFRHQSRVLTESSRMTLKEGEERGSCVGDMIGDVSEG